MLDLVEHYNKAIVKSAGNPLTSLPPTSLPPASLLPASSSPAFKPLISSPPAIFKRFNHYYAFTSLKRQVNRIATQNIQYKIAFELYMLTILF